MSTQPALGQGIAHSANGLALLAASAFYLPTQAAGRFAYTTHYDKVCTVHLNRHICVTLLHEKMHGHHTSPTVAAALLPFVPHRSGGWRLEPLPTGPRPEAVSAILAQQQQQQQELLWGTIDVPQLLTDLQVMVKDSLCVVLVDRQQAHSGC